MLPLYSVLLRVESLLVFGNRDHCEEAKSGRLDEVDYRGSGAGFFSHRPNPVLV